MSNTVSEALKNFILRELGSVERLEVLALLHRDPQRRWTAESASQELRSNTNWVQTHLEILKALELAGQEDKSFYFAPVDPARAQLVDEAVNIYRTKRVMVIDLIYSKPVEKIRDLADAFNFRRNK